MSARALTPSNQGGYESADVNKGYLFNFFLSVRRRHTRFDCDWSSDVCSSDLRRPHRILCLSLVLATNAGSRFESDNEQHVQPIHCFLPMRRAHATVSVSSLASIERTIGDRKSVV